MDELDKLACSIVLIVFLKRFTFLIAALAVIALVLHVAGVL
jgi:hypothetical protein